METNEPELKSHYRDLVQSFIKQHGNVSEGDNVPDDANLLVDGILDSVSTMQLIAHLESSLNRRFPPRDLTPANFMSVNAMVNYLDQQS